MKQTKRIMAFLMALLLTVTMLPVSVFAAENPTFSVSSASKKAGDEVTLSVDISNNPGFFAAQWTVSYDETRLEKVEYVMEEIDGVMLSNKNNNFLWENTAFDDIQYNGKVLDLKFKVKEDAPAGDAEVTITNLLAGKSNSAEVKFDVVAGKVTVAEKLETLIPFTKANHTDSGAPIHDKYSGIVGLKVEGIKVADWTEWKQGFNYQNQEIIIYVDSASKDDTATLSLVLKEGQAGSGSIIDAPATVKLNNGEGSFTASYMKIGTGGLAPMLHIPITFKLACTEHDWADATCKAPKTCTVCGATEGEPDPDAHNYVDDVCEYCGDVKEPETYEVKVFGGVNDCFYVSEGKSESGNEIIGEKLEGVQVKENGDYGFVVTVPNDVTRLCYFEGGLAQGFNVSPENNVVKIDYVELTVKTPDGEGCENAEVSIVDEEGYNVLAYDYEWGGIYSIYGVEGVKYIITVTAPGYKTTVVEKVFEYKNGYQTFDIVLECNHNWAEATCEAPKTCTVCGATEGEALGHNWGATSYKWEDDALSCTATRVCQNDAAHTESAEATVTSEVEKEPTCTESGITKYTATFDVDWAETQTNSKVDIEALGHSWVDADCDTPKTCSVCGATEGEALGHAWTVSYEWSEDGKSCKATRVCGNDEKHNVTAEATVTSVVAKEANCSVMGDTQYTATFTVAWAETQVTVRTDIAIDEDAHEWGAWKTVKEASYTEEGSKKRVCENDESHVETETIEKLVPTATEKTEGPDDTKQYVVAYQEGVVMVPAGLENEYPNQQAVKDALKAKVENGDLKGEVNLVFREVTAGYYENGAFVPVPNSEFFENGRTIDILLKYPEGADENDKFEVYHLRDDGVIEKCVIKDKTNEGLVIEVGSLSPFAIAYESVDNTPNRPSNPGKPSKPSNKPNPGITIITPEDEKEESNPNTGAPVVCSFDLTAAGVVVLAATAAVLEIKRRK